jgi:hypothetical protein
MPRKDKNWIRNTRQKTVRRRNVRFDVLTVVQMMITNAWYVTPATQIPDSIMREAHEIYHKYL